MVKRLSAAILAATFLTAPQIQLSMEKQETFLDDDYADPHSIVLRWQSEPVKKFLAMLEKAEKNKAKMDYPSRENSIGSFDGTKGKVVTYFKKNYIKIVSFKKFRILFPVNEYLESYRLLLPENPDQQNDTSKGKKQRFKNTKKLLNRVKSLRNK